MFRRLFFLQYFLLLSLVGAWNCEGKAFRGRTRATAAFASRRPRRRSTKLHISRISSLESNNANDHHTENRASRSQIREIRSNNLAGVVSVSADEATPGTDIVIPFQEGQHLVAVSGETGSGKSLLVARVVELLTGGKASATFLTNNESSATVEMELLLRDPFLSAAKEAFTKLGLDASSLTFGRLHLSRTLMMQPSNSCRSRIKSKCQINGQTVTLKVLAAVASPLLAIVDAATAAAALSKPDSRMAILDTGVRSEVLFRVLETSRIYRNRRKEREGLENELASRTLPQSFKSSSDESDLELLNHWINELDSFEKRVSRFCESLQIDDDDEARRSALEMIGRKLAATSWSDNLTPGHATFVSSMLSTLTDFRDVLRSLDDQIIAARNAIDALTSLSSPNSAITAMERARGFLFDTASPTEEEGSALASATEHSHELLNDVETALSKCAKFLEDDERGPLRTLENSRARCIVSVESVDEILLEWNTLARKHGILSNTLPSCHMALKSERDGNVEARTLLPKAIAAEEEALVEFQAACSVLTKERQEIASTLSQTVTQRLPSLGMDNSVFRVNLQMNARKCTDSSTYMQPSIPGLDAVDFMLLHSDSSERTVGGGRGGKVNEVASSGEKARILLAIECVLPGSVGATSALISDLWLGLPPIAVLYDEIDAHVGGRAAVSLANMLSDQSKSTQVVAITHSPSVAAVADMHIVIQKSNATNVGEGSTPVRASVVDNADRRRELARMASGDLAVEEAEIFADALIRDGLQRRNRSP